MHAKWLSWGHGSRVGLAVVLFAVVACGGGSNEPATSTPVASTTLTEPVATTTTLRSNAGVTLDAPTEVGAGTDFQVSWTGPDNHGDYVTIVAAGSEEGAYKSYFDTSVGAVGSLVAPNETGEYEIRYVDGDSAATVFSVPVSVMSVSVTLEADDEVAAGVEFEVDWTGPDGHDDYVTIVPADSPEGTYKSYFYTAVGPTGTLVSPVTLDDFEIRYVSGQDNKTLAARPIVIQPLAVTLSAPASVDRGASFAVEWTGPDGPSDYITIVAAGAPVGAYLDYAYTTEGNPLSITAPDQPGDYEIRYASDRVRDITFASIPIVVR